MGLFKKKKSWYEITITDSWSLFEGKYNNSPMIVRKNFGVKELVAHRDLPCHVGFAIPLNNPNKNGLPTEHENVVLSQIEDILLDALKNSAVLVLVITTNRMREFVFYSNSSDDIIRWYENGNQKIKDHQIQIAVEVDKSWGVYKQFT